MVSRKRKLTLMFNINITTTNSRRQVIIFLFVSLLTGLFATQVRAQEKTQTIRGTVIDKDGKYTLPGATVVVLNTDPLLGTTTDASGSFRLEKVPIGRRSIAVNFIGYEQAVVSNVLVSIGKELVLRIELQESITQLQQAEIVADPDKGESLNEMSLMSSRKFSVEETKRYAGSFDDPARMVSSFAGVNSDAQGDNDIVVRGNSPKGILWRLEGMEIPNPNHFAFEGGTGGPINALNSAMLANSDFMTGAFSAEYGNVLSGCFDMRLRAGNNEQQEYTATLSVLGTDLTAEGPIREGYAGSYLVNYRYSTLSILDELGVVDFGGVPTYQDASFKVVLPAGEKHVFSLFGLGGISGIDQEETSLDNEELILWKGTSGSDLGVVGLNHTYQISERLYMQNGLSISGTNQYDQYYSTDSTDVLFEEFNASFKKGQMQFKSTLNFKQDARNKFKAGIILSHQNFNMYSQQRDFSDEPLMPTLNQVGNTQLVQGFVNWKHRLSEDLTMVSGLHTMHFVLTGQTVVEPRWAMEWQQNEAQAWNLGFGLHSKTESISNYLAQSTDDNGVVSRPNKELGLSRALHSVAGFNRFITPNMVMKAEAYYQYLFDVPVHRDESSSYSLLNSTGWYTTQALENSGTGQNYGVELTLERFFSDGFYGMSTLSLYKSTYTGSDGIEHNSKFDGNYVFNVLGGKEMSVGSPEKNKTLFINTKLALIGGNRFTPLLLDESAEVGYSVRDSSRPFTEKGDDIFKLDFAIGMRWEKKRTSSELKLDVQNLTNNQAVVYEYYDGDTEQVEAAYQLGLIPVLSYRVHF